ASFPAISAQGSWEGIIKPVVGRTSLVVGRWSSSLADGHSPAIEDHMRMLALQSIGSMRNAAAQLNGALFPAHSHIDQGEVGALAFVLLVVPRINGHNVLVALCPGFQLDGFPVILAFALQLFGIALVRVVLV